MRLSTQIAVEYILLITVWACAVGLIGYGAYIDILYLFFR